MQLQIAPVGLGFLIAVIVLIVGVLALLGAIAATPQLLLIAVILLALARLT